MNVIPWNGEKISKPGIYSGMKIADYHSDICVGPSISSSGLRTIVSKSPAHYWVESPLNPKRIERESKDHFDLGHAAHSLLLGEGTFRQEFAIQPKEYQVPKGEIKPWHNGATYCKEWNASMAALKRTVITEDDLVQVRGMAEALAATPEIADGLFDGLVEHSIFWQDEKTGIWLKSRPDVLPKISTIVDLKTTRDAKPSLVDKAVIDHGYFIQLWLAGEGIKQVAGTVINEFVLVFVESLPPHAVTITSLDIEGRFDFGKRVPSLMEIAERQTRRAIDIFAQCVKTGEWPAYGGPRVTYAPAWLVAKDELDERYATAE